MFCKSKSKSNAVFGDSSGLEREESGESSSDDSILPQTKKPKIQEKTAEAKDKPRIRLGKNDLENLNALWADKVRRHPLIDSNDRQKRNWVEKIVQC